jgi:hypothetical protein
MAEPTSGPWRACTDPNDMPQLLYSGLIAPIFYSPDEYVAVVSETHDVGDYAECCADAALMAAAPALRDSLIRLLREFHEDLGAWIDDREDILAMLRVAEGALVHSGLTIQEVEAEVGYSVTLKEATHAS